MPGDILTWPEVGSTHITFGILFVFGVLLVFVVTRGIYLRAGRRDARWSVLIQYAMRHQVRGKDLKILRRFYDGLTNDESLRVVDDRRYFHASLHDFLSSGRNISPLHMRDRVRMLDSLFPYANIQLDIKSIRDLQPGEICSLEFDSPEEPRLCTILRRKNDAVWLSAPGWSPASMPDGDQAQIYIFRPDAGGFLIEGRILRAEKEAVLFGDIGQIQPYGDRHLMAAIEVPLTLIPWPPIPAAPPQKMESEESQSPEASSPEAQSTPARVVPIQIQGTCKLVSDRALLFFTEDQSSGDEGIGRGGRDLLEGQEVWEIDLVLPGGFAFRCRGIVLPSGQGGRGRWLFKYLDADESQRRAIFEEIKGAGPKRERLV